ncbi:universal stress protein [Mucilaginibacter sp. L196]|uniref:universal stress protein n=1 Tax=Mucilaginibacter sp. L196 TaxID=1641870 RepID=UPI00131B5499|nr:universal stress protein [Mucilaginibacter sp. L196]
MKTYLVPIDFSKASINAAEYAAALSHQTNVGHIILLNAYYVSIYETSLPSPDMVLLREEDIEQNAADRIEKLTSLKHKLAKQVRPGVEISVHLNRTHLLRAVIENSISKNVDLIILGSQGNSSSEDSHIGSHVIKIAKASPIPIIVVPPAYTFKKVSRVVVAIDFNKVKDTVPLEALQRLLDKKKAELMVVNVDDKGKHLQGDAERMIEETTLHKMLKQYDPKYFFLEDTDVISGILQFAAHKDAQLVIALPHKYSFFQSIMHTSISHQLAASSAVPVLLLK